ncbi:Uncharacterised protein [Burkholderia pseudomallei]|nr:Uncharacterised protein [Burkholderia pseudomallei]CAJ6692291.1 Uncharacterised protein [Burkholderia pseudomallei]HEP6430548.1 hypothetical protein [Burkholderia cenocepacia]
MNPLAYRCASTGFSVDEVPTDAVWIDGDDHESLDAVRMRCASTTARFIEAALSAGLVSAQEIARGDVWVTVDRSDSNQRGDVNVETQTDIFEFEPLERGRAGGPSFVPIRGLDILDDER